MMARIHGAWFWVFLIYGYALCLTSIVLLVREFFSRKGIYRSQVAVLLVGCLVPFAGNWLYSLGIEPVPNLDFTVYGFFITGISMAWGLFRFQLPVIMPLARQTVFESMSDGVIALDTAGNVVEVNPEAARILGQPSTLLIGRPATTVFRPYLDLADFCVNGNGTRAELAVGPSRRFEVRRSLLETRKQQVLGSLIVLRDITERKATEAALRQAHAALEDRIAERTADLSRTIEELRQLEDQLTFSASHDSLTQLPNRKLFLDRVTQRLEMTAGRAATFAILYVDIDRFKVYNDGYGHHLGDLILVEIGRRLKKCLTGSDTVARMGGDEFTILLSEVANAGGASTMAQHLLRAIATPVQLSGLEIHLTASIGIALGTDGRVAEDLVRDADLAMYHAKRQGGNRTGFFGESMRSLALSLVQLQQDLRFAVARNQIVVYYQPFVQMQTGRVAGFEALVRWRHPDRGLLKPAEFLPIAEQTGMLMTIDEFVLREACRQKDSWERAVPAGSERPFVSVNVAGWQFSNPRRWWRALSSLNSQTAGLRLEMMESVLVTNAHAAAEFFEQVRAHKLEVYLDDFGTGYSSLGWLSHYPIRSLKIDRSFVEEIAGGGRAASVVRAIIALAHTLKMEVVAEGIECDRQSEILRDLGCEFGQGFYFSPPVDGPTTLGMLN